MKDDDLHKVLCEELEGTWKDGFTAGILFSLIILPLIILGMII